MSSPSCDRSSPCAGKVDLFEALRPALTGDAGRPGYAAIATRLGTTEGAIQVAVHRLRRRYREVLRARIAATLADPADVDDEIAPCSPRWPNKNLREDS